jgi:hypothetical protein
MLTTCMTEKGEEKSISDLLSERDVFQVDKKNFIGRELNMTTNIGGYDMDGVMLDLGFNVNILTKKSSEVMGKDKLVWSPI